MTENLPPDTSSPAKTPEALPPRPTLLRRVREEIRARDVILVVVSALLGFILGQAGGCWQAERSAKADRHRQYISRPVLMPRVRLPLLVDPGTGADIVSRPGRPVGFAQAYQMTIGSGGEILVRGDIRDAEGRIAIYLRGNIVEISPSLGYDVNSDSQAMEVVDDDGLPVLQMELFGPDHLRILHHSFIWSREGKLLGVDQCGTEGCITTPSLRNPILRKGRPKPLFAYPGDENPGKRRPVNFTPSRETQPRPSPTPVPVGPTPWQLPPPK